MKKDHRLLFCLSLFFLFNWGVSNGQEISCLHNGDFETLLNSSTCEVESFDSFTGVKDGIYQGCSPGWFSAHGSPDLVSSYTGSTPFEPLEGDFFAIMNIIDYWDHPCTKEAIFYEYDFIPGIEYVLSFYHRTGGPSPYPIGVDVLLTQGLVNTTEEDAPCSDLNFIQPKNLYSKFELIQDNWVKVEVTFMAEEGQNQLVFVPSLAVSGPPIDRIWAIDKVEIKNCCDLTDSPDFDIEAICDNGNWKVEAHAIDDLPPNNMWELYETDTDGMVDEANTIGQYGNSQFGPSAAWSWLPKGRFFYIKHSIWDGECYDVRELSLPVPSFNTAIPAFHFEDDDGNEENVFCVGEDIHFNGLASTGENRYYIDAWRRPIGSSSAPFSYYANYGWTIDATVPELNLSTEFASLGASFDSGYEYQIKLAVMNLAECAAWADVTHEFTVECCEDFLDTSFDLAITPGGLLTVSGFETYPNFPDIQHTWNVFSAVTIEPFSGIEFLGSFNELPFTFQTEQTELWYFVSHHIVIGGCKASKHFEFIYREAEICEIPVNLNCETDPFTGQINLTWTPVTGATNYSVGIVVNDNSCCGKGNGALGTILNTNTPNLTLAFNPTCFSWTVRAVCGEVGMSDSSERNCYNAGNCSPGTAPCPTDFNGDGITNYPDYLIFLNQYGTDCTGECPTDLNGDGVTDYLDYLLFSPEINQPCNEVNTVVNSNSFEIPNSDALGIPNSRINNNLNSDNSMQKLNNNGNTKVKVFPNPVISTLNIQPESDFEYEIQLYDLNGKLLLQSKNATEISVLDFPTGIYILEIRNLDSNQKTMERIVVTK